MSTNTFIRASLLATVGVAAMSVTACANQSNSRYGNVYDYESGQNCVAPCTVSAPAQVSSRYGAAPAPAPVAPVYMPAPAPQAAPIYVDCTMTGTCAPAPAYAAPATTTYAQSYNTAPVNCPAGTTAQPDGTCMQTGVGSVTLPGTYSGLSTGSSSYSSTMTMGEPVNCPAGTTAQSDGTCMQGGSSSYSMGSTSSYSSDSWSSASSMGAPVNCPAGTTAQPDGTCMQGGSSASSSYSGSSVEIYTGDASTTSTTQSYGYTTDGAYGPTDYLPIRK